VSNEREDGGPAFPVIPPDTHTYREWPAYPGMSLRDYFAAKAIEGIISAYAGPECSLPNDDTAAVLAYRYADAMLKAR
jgi:hypothetical protein